MAMSIDEAVVVLNREKWRGRDDWQVAPWGGGIAACLPIAYHGTVVQAASHVLDPPDAIAIASWLELREAVQPFVRQAQWVVTCKLPDPEHVGAVLVKHWKRLAALAGEQK
jgi:hypothetical protein